MDMYAIATMGAKDLIEEFNSCPGNATLSIGP